MLTDAEERALRELAAATAAVDRRFARRLAAGPFGRRERYRRAAVVASAVVGAGTLDSLFDHRPRPAMAGAGALAVLAVGIAVGRARAQRRRPAGTAPA